MIALALALAVLQAPRPPLPPVPDGWVQVPHESYHGPEGAYHDRVSGALVQYCICPSPGAEETGIPDWAIRRLGPVKEGSVGELLYAEFAAGRVGRGFAFAIAYYENDGRFIGLFRVHAANERQEARARVLLLGGSQVWMRGYPDYKYLGRDAKESDWAALALGSDLPTFIRLTGVPSETKPLASGGFKVMQLFRTNDLKGSRWVWVEFSQDQRVSKK